MISGPCDDVDEGAGSGSGDAEDGIFVVVGGVGTASDVDAVTSGGGATEEEDDGCDEASGGGTMDEGDGDGGTELSRALDVVGIAEDDIADSVGVGAGISDMEDDGAGAVGVGSTTSEDKLAIEEDKATELGATGSGIAEETGNSDVTLDSKVGVGDGMTVVYDVTITTGGTWRDADGDASAGVFDGDGMGTPAISDVDEVNDTDSWACVGIADSCAGV